MKKVERLPEWRFGIDFGTSNTYVVAYEGRGQIDGGSKIILDKFANAFVYDPGDISGDYNIPTRVTFNSDDAQADPTMLIGGEVRKYPILRIFSGLKQAARKLTPPDGKFGEGEAKPREYPFGQCDPETSLQFGTADLPIVHSVHELLVEFFKKILHIGDDTLHVDKTTVKKLVIGCPANKQLDRSTSAEYKETLKDILTECFLGKNQIEEEREAFKKNINVIEEPVLAGETYLYGDGISEKNVLVIDIGGGTTDFAIVHYGKDMHEDSELEADISASCEIAGNAIDDFIFKLLPDGFPKSKTRCMQAKEQLFGKNKAGDLGQCGEEHLAIYYDAKTRDKEGANYILLAEGELYLGRELKKKFEGGIEKAIYKPIWDKLKVMLEVWKKKKEEGVEKEKITINTIFFVGGTSIIKPLRDYLTKEVCNFFGIPVEEKEEEKEIEIKGDLKVETLFGKHQRKLEVVGDEGLPIVITSYNAVAIGACIKAIYGGKCAIKPKVTFRWIYNDRDKIFDVDSGHILLAISKEVIIPTSCIFIEPKSLDDFLEVREDEINRNSIQWTVGEAEPHCWKIEAIPGKTATDVLNEKILELQKKSIITRKNEAGVLIVLSGNSDAPQCKFYICKQPRRFDPETETDRVTSIEDYIAKNQFDIHEVVKGLQGHEIRLVKIS